MIKFGKKKIKFHRQLESLDCAPACLKMICEYHGKNVSLSFLRDICKTSKLGTSIFSLVSGARMIGLDTVSAQINLSGIKEKIPLPAILLWNKSHFVVLSKVISPKKNGIYRFFTKKEKFLIADPAFGFLKISSEEFAQKWCGDSTRGVIIFMEPLETFNKLIQPIDYKEPSKAYFNKLLQLIYKNKVGLSFIIIGMVFSSGISLAFPILTQRIVDIGIKMSDISFVTLILLFQIGLFLSMILIDAVRSWITLHIGAKIELNLTHDFLYKLMRLPLYFFDMKVAGDLMQRISDNSRIQVFIKTQLLDFFVSIATLISLSFLLLHYNKNIFFVFLLGSIAAIVWTFHFIRRREILDYRRFDVNTENTDNLIETIIAMPEVKLNNAEEIKMDSWQKIQIKLFNINSKILLINQYQNTGSTAINQLKNIIVTFLAAQLVITNSLSLGEMLALSAIIGQLNVPLFQMVGFIQNLQESRISFQRLAEVQSKEDEDSGYKNDNLEVKKLLSSFGEIEICNINFSYSYSDDDLLFNKLSLKLPVGKVTALVGATGSGKTTLMKLLLKFYEPLSGSIKIGTVNLNEIRCANWRRHCGVVMQEGHLFTDTVENNIAMSTDKIDKEWLYEAARMSCINSFIQSLPMGYSTKIGSGGMGISTGQKQRILIARAIYKNPDILFLDEATTSLDTNTEKEIQKNLNVFFKNKTVFIIAHRLSTVKDADNIIVLKSGEIIEQGNHEYLISQKTDYYNLIKNQLELGN